MLGGAAASRPQSGNSFDKACRAWIPISYREYTRRDGRPGYSHQVNAREFRRFATSPVFRDETPPEGITDNGLQEDGTAPEAAA